jgi:hypothetical protein
MLVMAGLGIAGYLTVFPASPEHRADFLSGLVRDVPRHPMLLISIAAVLALGAAFAAPHRPAVALLPLVLGFASIGLSAAGRIATAGVSFNARSLTGTLLPLLLVAAAFLHSRPIRLGRRGWILAGVTLVTLIGGYVTSWSAWRGFREDFMTVLDTHTGYVPVTETIVGANSQRWRWTTSLLSILWSPQCVRTILVSSSPGWYPFDPRQSLPLQHTVRYHESFLAASPNATHCR